MSIVLDTGAVVALMTETDPHHRRAAAFVAEADAELITSPMCASEMDYLVRKYGGPIAQRALWSSFEQGSFTARWWADALGETIAIAREHPKLGLSDASLVALADRLQTDRIFTFDSDFENLTTPMGHALRLVPERT